MISGEEQIKKYLGEQVTMSKKADNDEISKDGTCEKCHIYEIYTILSHGVNKGCNVCYYCWHGLR